MRPRRSLSEPARPGAVAMPIATEYVIRRSSAVPGRAVRRVQDISPPCPGTSWLRLGCSRIRSASRRPRTSLPDQTGVQLQRYLPTSCSLSEQRLTALGLTREDRNTHVSFLQRLFGNGAQDFLNRRNATRRFINTVLEHREHSFFSSFVFKRLRGRTLQH